MVLTWLLAVVVVAVADAQRLVIGEKAPELKVAKWVDGAVPVEGRPRMVEFVVSSSAPSVKRIGVLKALAHKYRDNLDVVLVVRESPEKIAPLIGEREALLVGYDDGGKTCVAFDVQYVPFGVLIDRRGRVVWSGNASMFEEDQLFGVL